MMQLHLIQKYFYPNTVLDIGAHLGEFYNCVKYNFSNALVTSVEAQPECEEQLKNINPNSIIALLAKENKEYNWYRTTNDSICTGNSLYKEKTEHFSGEKLIVEKRQGITLKELFGEKTFDLIKLDTQGSELDIIQGGLDICKKAKGIIIEVSFTNYNEGAPMYEQVVEYMKNIGFEEKEILNVFHYGNLLQKDILFINKYLSESSLQT